MRIQTATRAIRGVAVAAPSSMACAVAIRDRPRVAFPSTTAGTVKRYERPERRKLHCHSANIALEVLVAHDDGRVLAPPTNVRSGSRVKFTWTSGREPPPETFTQMPYVIVSFRSADRRSATRARV